MDQSSGRSTALKSGDFGCRFLPGIFKPTAPTFAKKERLEAVFIPGTSAVWCC
jgi:hypothetical protein